MTKMEMDIPPEPTLIFSDENIVEEKFQDGINDIVNETQIKNAII